MIKQCAACGKDFDAVRNAKYCPSCRPSIHKIKNRELSRRWRKTHRGYHSLKSRIWREQNPDKVKLRRQKLTARRQLERKKARLRAIMQANAAKRQAAQQRHKELYQGMAHWDKELPTTSI